MFKRSFSRGTSIVAALALVGLLSVALVFSQYLLPNAHPSSQTAEAGDAMRSTPVPKVAGVSAACSAARDSAAATGQNNSQVALDSSKNDLVDDCVGAILDTSKQNPNPSDPNSYKCVGKTATVSVNGTKVTDKSYPDASQPEGKCKTLACSPAESGKQSCFSAVLGGLTGKGLTNTLAGQTEGISPFTTNALTNIYSPSTGLPIDQPSATAVNDAFSKQMDTQIQTQNQSVDTAKQQLDYIANNCAFGGSTTDQSCVQATQVAQQNLDSEKQKLEDMQNQKTAFAATAQNDLTPDTTLDCSTADNANNPRCFPATTGDPTGGCPAGQVNYGGTCKTTKAGDTFPPPAATTPAPAPSKPSGGGIGNVGQLLQSFLGGLMRGLGGAGAPPAGPACPTDPAAYAAQQQQYQQQMQQYQYQIQQYQFYRQQQQFQAQTTGYIPVAQPMPPTAPVPCTPTSSSNTCAAAPAQPTTACPAGTTLRPITAQQSNGASCTTGWQCGASTAVTPTAQISCQPQVADVGMAVSISFGCTNATGSQSGGFNSLGATSGSTSTIITAPPAGVNAATFGITCINQNLSGQASCSVQVSRPSIVLVANPKVVATSTASTVGWVTSGMKSCVVSSPQQSDFTATNAGNTSVSGMATTSPITQDTDILLHCITLGGGTRDATTTITSSAAGSGSSGQAGDITVSSSADGGNIARGAVNTVEWSATSTPSGSKMSLWLYDVRLNQVTGLIKNELNANGTYAWTLPTAGSTCDASSSLVCGTDLVPGRQYGIEADLYTGDPANASYRARGYTSDVFTISQ